MIDLYIADFGKNKTVDLIKDNRQRCENWVRIDNDHYFSSFGVKYSKYIFDNSGLNDINLNGLAVLTQTELSNNQMPCLVDVKNNNMFELNFIIQLLKV